MIGKSTVNSLDLVFHLFSIVGQFFCNGEGVFVIFSHSCTIKS